IVRIDIDPTQIMVNLRPDIALVGDADATLAALLTRIGETPEPPSRTETTQWSRRIADEARAEGHLWATEMDCIAEVLDRDAIVAGDSAAVCYYGLRSNLRLHRPGSFLYPTGYGTLGYGLPAAIGAKIGAPDRQVIAVLGDGGIMFTLPEIAAAAAAGLALPILVVDNSGYGQIRRNMLLRNYEPLGVDIQAPDFAAVARSLGCHGVTIESPGHLTQSLKSALEADRPTVLHVREGMFT
ncbi:MAG: thiamine pyrophosphate-dependent enzyme, partial [Pseudonocardiaceae bacterium]